MMMVMMMVMVMRRGRRTMTTVRFPRKRGRRGKNRHRCNNVLLHSESFLSIFHMDLQRAAGEERADRLAGGDHRQHRLPPVGDIGVDSRVDRSLDGLEL